MLCIILWHNIILLSLLLFCYPSRPSTLTESDTYWGRRGWHGLVHPHHLAHAQLAAPMTAAMTLRLSEMKITKLWNREYRGALGIIIFPSFLGSLTWPVLLCKTLLLPALSAVGPGPAQGDNKQSFVTSPAAKHCSRSSMSNDGFPYWARWAPEHWMCWNCRPP
jgi:hypothetical protein